MKLEQIRELLKNKQVIEEINKHLWIESQKAGYSIGIERATDEWLRLYAEAWMKFHMVGKGNSYRKRLKQKAVKRVAKKTVKKTVKKAKKKIIKKKK